MDDLKETLKKYWPYAVGILVGLYLVYRYMAGGAGSSSSSSDSSAYYSALNAQNQASLQSQIANAQIAAQTEQAQREYSLAQSRLELDRETAAGNQQVAFLSTQAQMAQAVGAASSAVIGQLFQPTIAAINAAGYENAATMSAAANVAAAGFGAQADIVGHTSTVTQAVAQTVNTWGEISLGLGNMFAGSQSGLSSLTNIARPLSGYSGDIQLMGF